MVDRGSRFRPSRPNPGDVEEDLARSKARLAPYNMGRSVRNDYAARSKPLFLSSPDDESRLWKTLLSPKVLATVVVVSAGVMLVAWLSFGATRDTHPRAPIATRLPMQSAAAQVDAAQFSSGDLRLKGTAQSADPPAPPQAVPAPAPAVVADVAPLQGTVTDAYSDAPQTRAPATPPAAPQAVEPMRPLTPQVKRSPQELATLMKRAKEMLAMGDISAARLLLERAAGSDATAALVLARTYDPAVLGTSDGRNITPEPSKAQAWYQKAAQLGSEEAQRLLARSHR